MTFKAWFLKLIQTWFHEWLLQPMRMLTCLHDDSSAGICGNVEGKQTEVEVNP